MGESDAHDGQTGKPPLAGLKLKVKISSEDLNGGLGSQSDATPLVSRNSDVGQGQAAPGVQAAKSVNELKTTESYSPRALWLWAENPDSFKAQIPSSLARFSDVSFRLIDVNSESVNKTFDGIRGQIDDFFVRGPSIVMKTIYLLWAQRNQITQEHPTSKQQVLVLLDELSADQLHRWEMYREVGDIPRSDALRVTSNLLVLLEPLYHKHTTNEMIDTMCGEMEQTKRAIVATILPDLTDEEAHMFFGHLTTAREVLDHRTFARHAGDSRVMLPGENAVGGHVLINSQRLLNAMK